MVVLNSYNRIATIIALLSCFILIQIPLSNADASNLNPNGEGCIDPQGYLDCYADQVKQASFCVNTVNKTCDAQQINNCVAGCYGAQLAGNIGCWIQSCWNRVYSCEYQATAIQYLSGADLIQSSVNIPFYPPPEDAPGRCSCNLGNVYSNQTYIWPGGSPCTEAAVSGNKQLLNDCFCCKDFVTVSNIFNECPKSDLTPLGIQNTVAQALANVEPYTTDKCAILDTDPSQCTSRYGIPVGSKFNNLLNLSPDLPGTEPLSDLPGQAFTDLGISSVTLKLFPGYSSVITPAPYNDKNAAATGTENLGDATIASGTVATSETATSGGNSDGSSGSAASKTDSGTSSTASSTGKPNGASLVVGSIGMRRTFGVVLLCIMVVGL